MKASIIKGALAAAALAGLLTAPALADDSTAASPSAAASTTPARHHHQRGCPQGFDAGDAAGVRVCHGKAGTWRLETTDPAKSGGHEYTGTLTTDGKFTDVQLIRPENDDSASIDGEGKLVYDFKTFSGIDGVQFHVADEATQITFNLTVDGQQLPANHIWIGKKGRHPDGDPFTLRLHRR